MHKAFAPLCVSVAFLLQSIPGSASTAAQRVPLFARDASGTSTFGLPDGSQIRIGADGFGERSNKTGTKFAPTMIVRPQARSAFEEHPGPSDLAIAERIASAHPGTFKSGEIVVEFRSSVNAAALARTVSTHRRIASAGVADRALARTLDDMRPLSARRLFNGLTASRVPELAQTFVFRIGAGSPIAAARKLRALASVAYASPNYYVGTFKTDPVPMPDWETKRARQSQPRRALSAGAPAVSLPTNYGLTSSLQAFLNSNSVDAVGAYAKLSGQYNQLPGTGERITNVSIGDLTDQSMADAGDGYVQYFGPTTIVQGGQRYLDIPSMPLIPTYTADMNAQLNPTGSTEYMDPFLGEVLLDFSVMAPLPHNMQRGNAVGSGDTDLLGIAPGAQYRLVIPQEPTFANIDIALLAAATQVPRPDVISASLGYGTDSIGFPGRYLEDDPLTQAIVSAIVRQYGIVVCISSNDGTRLYTNESVNPDGGSTSTDVIPNGGYPTSIGDDATSTTPSLVFDSGAIAAGGTTLDDVFAAPPWAGGALAAQHAFPETRIDGMLDFSSGFGSRVNVSAPSDNIASLVHECTSSPCTAQSVVSVLEGGTSASAPEIAASAAVVLQAGRLAGKSLTPLDVRRILEETGRAIPNPPQIARPLHVGPQLDLSAAVNSLLAGHGGSASVLRVAVAERQTIGNVGGYFVEATDPTNINLAGPVINSFIAQSSGQNAVSPITIAPDWLNVPRTAQYALTVNGKTLATTPSARLLPEAILNAAGMPLVSSATRTVTLTYAATAGKSTLASATIPLTFGATDGTYIESLAPTVPATVPLGQAVTVSYDLTHVRAQSGYVSTLLNPQLVVSSIGHWNPINAPYFRAAYTVPITSLKGSVTIPASVFASGGGLYGVGVIQNPALRLVGEFAPFRVGNAISTRPSAPTLSVAPNDPLQTHFLAVTRAQPKFSVQYDVSNVSGATGAMLEISAPGPTLGNLLNTFNNAFGTARDNNGVDAGSTIYQPLSGTQGSAALDAVALKLPSSLQYTIRVLAMQGSAVMGEASPVSSLEYDDVLAPGGAYVASFDIAPQGTSTVSTVSVGANGFPTDSAVFPYDPSTETFNSPFVEDTTGSNQYFVFGHDAQSNRTSVFDLGQPPPSNMIVTPPQALLSLDDATGNVASTATIDPATNETVVAGMVDANHHRLDVLTYNFYARHAQVAPLGLQTGSFGAPITVAASGHLPTSFDIDQSTGLLYLTALGFGDNCFIFRAPVYSLNIDTATVGTSTGAVRDCIANIASDQSGNKTYLAFGSLETIGGLPGFRSSLIPVNDASMSILPSHLLDDRGAYLSAVDPVNKVLLEGFVASNDLYSNNNAMSAVDVIDLPSGNTISHLPTFGFLYPLATGIPFPQRGIQVDPSTRTAWTYSASGTSVQQFSY